MVRAVTHEGEGGPPESNTDDATGAHDGTTSDESPPNDGTAAIDPYLLSSDDDTRYVFWADRIADLVEERSPEEPVIVKGGISPSGVPHLGNVNEIMRGYFVAEALRDRGYEVEQVFTSDDRDPLRGMPRTLADLDGSLVGLDEVDAGALGRNLGSPYTAIPDPFDCCRSYGDHFSKLIERSGEALGVDMRVLSMTELYERGAFDDVIHHLIEHRDEAREILKKYQSSVEDGYVPFNPICEGCGKITETVTDVDLSSETVSYRCTDLVAGEQTIPGCGHEGTATYRDGKLPWRFEWPAQWKVLGVDFEPFGKDHAEGSWQSGVDIARNLLDVRPPVPLVYEWFTLNGEPLSSSSGNVIMVEELLQLVEPEVIRYFFAKHPGKARDFDVERIDRLVEEFDGLERSALDGDGEATDREVRFARRVYPDLVDEVVEDRFRIPYRFAAVLGMTDDPAQREEIARREGHIPAEADRGRIERALERVERARTWARRMDNQYNYVLYRDEIPNVPLDDEAEAALDELAAFIERHEDPEEIQGEIYEVARRHGFDVGEFFSLGYRLFFDQEEGPRLGPFLAELDRDFVVDRLRRRR